MPYMVKVSFISRTVDWLRVDTMLEAPAQQAQQSPQCIDSDSFRGRQESGEECSAEIAAK